jgi:hypothetical protein
LEPVALKTAVEQVRGEYAFSQRRACGLMTMAEAWGLRQEARMPRKPKVQRTREEKWQIVLEGLKSGNVAETCR